ncbi:mitochondrial-processing peptidase subunit alpha-like protein [Dinothrombium tinctorium]|uniref:Mitochondrial-processing peptidase subunit alpha n=1 Tax=Dinothrombium tinctorium TaxID=1965070 RepID=A0A3S3NZV7_9ACAR|nr:mitochondrial-processing peptidase subunit alpha-like protein [Dinothrombium tinctorium]RWS05046.1 mitochondrial-processing peptidase subunit alpha-like protein [Dinothrombium tinctorium]RWS09896.1 mitochondrial-processing peptidase subunit alpha-like protein [Dinothrombium tinctorium]
MAIKALAKSARLLAKSRLVGGKNLYRRFDRLKSNVSSAVETGSEDITKVPLSQPLPGFPKPIYATAGKEEHSAKVTTLSNGLRVASEPKFGQFCTVGVIIDSGSRYEASFLSGISHFLEKLAFNSTINYNGKEDILKELERHGGICDCQGSRDTLIYAASVETKGLESVVRMLSEVILSPRITEEEINIARQTIAFELEDTAMKPDQETLLLEQIHAAAFRANTLGLPKLTPPENISRISRNMIYTYANLYHTPQRMVLAGVGVEHEKLVEFAQKDFVEKKPIWEEEMDIEKSIQVCNSVAQYTGGVIAVEKDLSNVNPGPSPIPELAHFVLGLESCSHQDLDDFIPTCVLNMVMGGGGSFSAGGPGKGMYTRLYTNVLNRFHWMYNATAYNHAYADDGLFCIHASAHPSQLRELVNIIVREFVNINSSISKTELERAKTQLKSMLLMNLEARPVLFEDLARQVLANGFKRSPQYFIEQIDKVSDDDIQRIGARMLKSKPSVAALGDVKQLPSLDDIETALNSKDGRIPKRFTLFR